MSATITTNSTMDLAQAIDFTVGRIHSNFTGFFVDTEFGTIAVQTTKNYDPLDPVTVVPFKHAPLTDFVISNIRSGVDVSYYVEVGFVRSQDFVLTYAEVARALCNVLLNDIVKEIGNDGYYGYEYSDPIFVKFCEDNAGFPASRVVEAMMDRDYSPRHSIASRRNSMKIRNMIEECCELKVNSAKFSDAVAKKTFYKYFEYGMYNFGNFGNTVMTAVIKAGGDYFFDTHKDEKKRNYSVILNEMLSKYSDDCSINLVPAIKKFITKIKDNKSRKATEK